MIQPPRKVPLNLIPKLKETLDNLTKSGVISKLDRATNWVNGLVEKKDGSLQLLIKTIKTGHYKAASTKPFQTTLERKYSQ